MGDVEIGQYTVPQLKKWLTSLGLPTEGRKAELVARLNQVAPDRRGNAPEWQSDAQSERDVGSDCEDQIVCAGPRRIARTSATVALGGPDKQMQQH
ncbi:hypothetical protein ACLKA7_017686 [Drosophila subpalustris]